MDAFYIEQSKNVANRWLLTVVLFVAFLVGSSFVQVEAVEGAGSFYIAKIIL
ncbi:MAG TPA: hypothetical protein VK675_03425 [Candidatus Paceibacterota bacterium]|nr:hypothetical protein [Candidatus Paceibacterota bacterium]